LDKKILISVGKKNFPEDVAKLLKPLAEVFYRSLWDEEYDIILKDSVAVIGDEERVDEKYLLKAPKLKIFANFGVGYDSVDVDLCTKRGIYVSNTPGVLSAAVADFTWALILGYARKVVAADSFVRKEWAKYHTEFPFGFDLEDKTLGIIGLGRIGSEVVKRAKGFGVKIIYYDVIHRPDIEREYDVKFTEFDELIRSSDIISLHVPLLPSTKHLLGEREFSLMKQTAILINTSRGAVIDQEALIKALKNGQIRGAGLDVFVKEPLPLDDRLIGLENVLLTPHAASGTLETRRKMAMTCAENVKAYLEGRYPPNIVPEQKNIAL